MSEGWFDILTLSGLWLGGHKRNSNSASRPIIVKPPIFSEEFKYSVPPSSWSTVSGEFSFGYERFLINISPGEIKYSGTTCFPSTADLAFALYFYSQPDTHIEIRARRLDDNNYICLELNQSDQFLKLKEIVDGTSTNLNTYSHYLRPSNLGIKHLFRGYKENCIAVWMCGKNIYGFLNGALLLQASSSEFQTSTGFSVYCGNTSQKLSRIYASQLFSQPNENPTVGQFEATYRHLLQSIVNPENRTWASLKNAIKVYNEYKDVFFKDATWTMLGFPLYPPATESWFGNNGIQEPDNS